MKRLLALVSERHRTEHRFSQLERAGRASRGAGTYGTPVVKTFAGDDTALRIGAYTSIAGGVEVILGGNHPVDRVSVYPFRERFGLLGSEPDGFPSSKGDVHIGSDVWIGTRAMILSGVSIGDGAVVAAGTVVVRDVPPYAIVAGVPSKVKRMRFEPDIVESLLQLRWWDWPIDDVRSAAPLLNGSIPIEEAIRALSNTRRHT